MSRPKLPKNDTKIKVSITLSRDLYNKLSKLTNNKSQTIENILTKHFSNE